MQSIADSELLALAHVVMETAITVITLSPWGG